ncbi:GlmU family protein [Polluticoccus soli]|uniref:GlmU family protein n=1 Tax=Polluticoccus soli TaxID=3034150 RepID=UPI0023E270BD|nr:GlmU family protein [Flavipsychrobacter sp. JY13-12]
MKNPDFCRDFSFMVITLFDTNARHNLLPFTHTRAIADIRCGIMTMRERWERFTGTTTGTLTEEYLQEIYPKNGEAGVYVSGAVLATQSVYEAARQLKDGQKLMSGSSLLAFNTSSDVTFANVESAAMNLEAVELSGDVLVLKNAWDIFSYNDKAIKEDFALLTNGRKSAGIPEGVTVAGKGLFIEEGASIAPGCIINTTSGPVYIGKDTEIMEGSMIRGPFAACEHSVVKMGAKIYGATTLGPGCKVGGELNNVVFFANSNKAHDGFLGNAVIGEWCNLGADTNCSNLKNNYDEVKVWNEQLNKSVKTGLNFCGLLMGDHSKAGINTMFNTGTVVGVSANIYGGGFPASFIPSFCWGGAEGLTTYRFDKATETANRMMGRRSKQLSEVEIKMLQYIFDKTKSQRDTFAQS